MTNETKEIIREIPAKHRKQRVERRPLAKQGPQAIAGEKDPNFAYRFVNDTGSRLPNFQSAGYEFVMDDDLTVGDSRVFDPSDLGSAKCVTSNDGTKSYLMRIKKEWYEEDQLAKTQRVDETEGAMQANSSQDYGTLKVTRR
jgi:hypothetical protein